jgi:hypothetical protein
MEKKIERLCEVVRGVVPITVQIKMQPSSGELTSTRMG